MTQVETEAEELVKFPIPLKSSKFSRSLVERHTKVSIIQIQLYHIISSLGEKLK